MKADEYDGEDEDENYDPDRTPDEPPYDWNDQD